jgi:glycosyltransferase involved in cell wall biosynthesis
MPVPGQPDSPAVLAVTSELPWPLDSGGHLRSFHLLRALAHRLDLRLVVPVPSHQAAELAALRDQGIRVVPVPVGPRTFATEVARVVSARLAGEPYVLYRRHARGAVRRAVRAEVARQRPDAFYLDHLDSFLYQVPGLPAVLDLHNVYSLLVRRLAGEQTNPLKRSFLSGEARRLARAERRAVRSADAVLSVSDQECQYYQGLGAGAVHVVPNGVDCAAFADLDSGRPGAGPVILFLGLLSWGPNVEAARFLAEAALPQVRAAIPDARLVLVGRDPVPEVRALARLGGVTVAANVPQVRPYLAEACALAVPLQSGGGTRLKILEAFAAGLPVVSTAVGAEGIAARAGHHLLVAERDDFPEALRRILTDMPLRARLAAEARVLARQEYDWARVAGVAIEVVRAAACSSDPRSRAASVSERAPSPGEGLPPDGRGEARERAAGAGWPAR